MTPYSRKEIIGDATLYLGDCLPIMQAMKDGEVDAVVTDPPYGINYNRVKGIFRKNRNRKQDQKIINDDKPFDPTPFLDFKKVVIWGAPCFSDRLPVNPAWLCWDKVTKNGLKLRIAEMELAWAKPLSRPQVYRCLWSGAYRIVERNEYYHPTQKPVSVMKWAMEAVKVDENDTVLDPFMGSGTTGVACQDLRCKFIGIEINEEYFDIACKRIEQAQMQLNLF